MVSYTPDTQPMNYTHMYSFEDLNGSLNGSQDEYSLCTNPDSLFGMIYNNKNYSRFKTIIDRSCMAGQLDQKQADFTLFAPPDHYLMKYPESFFTKMDDGFARQILKASMLNRRIGDELIKSSPCAYYYTLNPEMRMYVTNIDKDTIINNRCKVISKAVCLDNGLFYAINNLIIPTDQHFMN